MFLLKRVVLKSFVKERTEIINPLIFYLFLFIFCFGISCNAEVISEMFMIA